MAVNIEIMRAFVRLREILSTHKDLARRLNDLEKKYDKQFAVVFDTIRKLMTPPDYTKREAGGNYGSARHVLTFFLQNKRGNGFSDVAALVRWIMRFKTWFD